MLYYKKNYIQVYIIIGFLWSIIFACSPSYAQIDASRATRESDRFGNEAEKRVEKELRRVPQKQAEPILETEKPKEGEQKFLVRKIELVGCESFPTEDFMPLIKKFEGKDVTLTELNNLAKEISNEYLKRGVIAAIFLPPQEIKNETVTLQVVEARMGELEIQKSPFFKKSMLRYYWNIKSGDILRYDKISKSLQMMNKNPDREVRAALHAGDKPGTTNIILTPKTRFPIHGQYTFDREGILTTGKIRNGFGMRDNNATGYDDTAITGISYGKNFNGIYAYHSLPISPTGASLLYGYSYSKSTPQKDFDVYALKSVSETMTGSVHQDLYSKDEYLGEISAGIDSNDKVSWYKLGQGTLSRDRLRILNITGNFTLRGEGSVTSINPELDQGINAFGASKSDNPLSSRPGATPTYTKFSLGIQNRTNLPFNLQQSLRFRMQLPSEKLFSQEQFGMGGIDTVRGYPPSDFLADKMALLNAEMLSPVFFLPKEWKLPYDNKPLKEQLTGVTFFDYGYGELRGNPKPFRMASVGVGLRMNFYNQVLLRLEWGFPLKLLGMDPLTEGKAPARFHISLSIEDKLPSEIERIIKEMDEEKIEKESWALVDEELARPDSPIKQKISDYLSIGQNLYKHGRLRESREMYATVANMSKLLYQQAEKYVKECKVHEEDLYRRNDDAMAAYREGNLDEAKKIWQEIEKNSKPRPLVFEF